MGWTTPKTWVSGEIVHAATMNAQIRDNLNYLKGTGGTDIQLDSGLVIGVDATQFRTSPMIIHAKPSGGSYEEALKVTRTGATTKTLEIKYGGSYETIYHSGNFEAQHAHNSVLTDNVASPYSLTGSFATIMSITPTSGTVDTVHLWMAWATVTIQYNAGDADFVQLEWTSGDYQTSYFFKNVKFGETTGCTHASIDATIATGIVVYVDGSDLSPATTIELQAKSNDATPSSTIATASYMYGIDMGSKNW